MVYFKIWASHKNYFNSSRYVFLSQIFSDFLKVAKNNKGKNPSEIKTKKRGRPSLSPDELMTKVISMLEALHLKVAPETAEVINSVAKGFIIANDRSLLIQKRGYISLSHQWGCNVFYRMEQEGKKMCRWKTATQKIPVTPGPNKRSQVTFSTTN